MEVTDRLILFFHKILSLAGNVFTQVSSALQSEGAVSYAGAQVWRTLLRDGVDHLLIQKLADDEDISLWNVEHIRAEYLVREENKVKVNRLLMKSQLNHTVLILDVQRRIDVTRADGPNIWTRPALRLGHRMNWHSYPSMNIIEEYFQYLAVNFPSICKIKSVGRSVEERPIQMISISNGNPANKVVFLTGGVHAREWIGITSIFYIINNIVTKFDQQPDYITNKDWHFIPLVNPDGFEYTHTNDRLWRKNRHKISSCYGVDLNRNYDVSFGLGPGADPDACRQAYPGLYPFSEPETTAVRKAILRLRKKPSAYVDFHSYGQLVLHPWSTNTQKPYHDEKLLRTTAAEMVQAIFSATNEKYRTGRAPEMIYPASGAGIDWVYSQGTPLSFALEARDTGAHGFLLPRHFIEVTGKEMLGAIRCLARVLDTALGNISQTNQTRWF